VIFCTCPLTSVASAAGNHDHVRAYIRGERERHTARERERKREQERARENKQEKERERERERERQKPCVSRECWNQQSKESIMIYTFSHGQDDANSHIREIRECWTRQSKESIMMYTFSHG